MSYNSDWQEVTTKILQQIKFDLQATDILPKENVRIMGAFAQWEPRSEDYPNALIRMTRDRVGFATRDEEEHTFMVDVLTSMKGTVQDPYDADAIEADEFRFLDLIGQIEEAIRVDNTLNNEANWALFRDKNLVYGFSEGYLFYECLMLLEVKKVW